VSPPLFAKDGYALIIGENGTVIQNVFGLFLEMWLFDRNVK